MRLKRRWYVVALDNPADGRLYVTEDQGVTRDCNAACQHSKREAISRAKYGVPSHLVRRGVYAAITVREVTVDGTRVVVGREVWPNPNVIESIASLA